MASYFVTIFGSATVFNYSSLCVLYVVQRIGQPDSLFSFFLLTTAMQANYEQPVGLYETAVENR